MLQHTCEGQKTILGESVISICLYVGSRDWTRVSGLCSRHLCLLSHLARLCHINMLLSATKQYYSFGTYVDLYALHYLVPSITIAFLMDDII